jgi:hypothetical protein
VAPFEGNSGPGGSATAATAGSPALPAAAAAPPAAADAPSPPAPAVGETIVDVLDVIAIVGNAGVPAAAPTAAADVGALEAAATAPAAARIELPGLACAGAPGMTRGTNDVLAVLGIDAVAALSSGAIGSALHAANTAHPRKLRALTIGRMRGCVARRVGRVTHPCKRSRALRSECPLVVWPARSCGRFPQSVPQMGSQ